MEILSGYWTVIIEAACCLLYIRTQRLRFSLRRTLAYGLAFLVLMLLLQGVYFQMPMLTVRAEMLINIILLKLIPMFLSCLLLTEGGLCTAMFLFAEAFTTAELIAAVIQNLLLPAAEAAGLQLSWQRGAVTALALAAGILILCAVQRWIGVFGSDRSGEPLRVGRRTALPASAVSYISFAVNYISEWGTEEDGRFLSITIYLSGLLILFLLEYSLRGEQLRAEMQTVQHTLDLRYQQVQDYMDNTAYLRRQLHDLKHQITGLRALGSGELDAVLNEVEQAAAQHETWNVSGNEVLDALLTQQKQICARKGISLLCTADGKALDFLPARDICTIFGNLLDNAAEAAGRLSDPDSRIIQVRIARKAGFLVARIENRYTEETGMRKMDGGGAAAAGGPGQRAAGEVVYTGTEASAGSAEGVKFAPDGLPRTTKENPSEHGIGLKSVRLTVEQHGGTLQLTAQDGWFVAGVMIPAGEFYSA